MDLRQTAGWFIKKKAEEILYYTVQWLFPLFLFLKEYFKSCSFLWLHLYNKWNSSMQNGFYFWVPDVKITGQEMSDMPAAVKMACIYGIHKGFLLDALAMVKEGIESEALLSSIQLSCQCNTHLPFPYIAAYLPSSKIMGFACLKMVYSG